MKKRFPVSLLFFALLGCATSNKAIEKEIVALYQKMNGEVYHDREIIQQQELLRSQLTDRGYLEKREYTVEIEPETKTWDNALSQIQKLLKENGNKAASVAMRPYLVNYEQEGLIITVRDTPGKMKTWDQLIENINLANQAEMAMP